VVSALCRWPETATPASFSINGQRESANGFYLNGASVQETIGQQAGIIPNLYSIAEFRILTSNADAEYGGYSGGIVNVITKSGVNEVHGSAFEFLRNTELDARGFFSPERSAFQQNQFGSTLGGPILKNKLFFFGDYQGQRTIQGIETGLVQVPSVVERGDFMDATNTLTGKVNGAYLAQTLTNRLGYGVTGGEPYYFPGCRRRSYASCRMRPSRSAPFRCPLYGCCNTSPRRTSERTCSRPGQKRKL
jgi:hypothetical protein